MAINRTRYFEQLAVTLLLLAAGGAPQVAAADASQQDSQTRTARAIATADAGALKLAAIDPQVRAFYSEDGWAPVWSRASEDALEQALAGRDAHGLDKVCFLEPAKGNQDPAKREVALTGAALRYARALSNGLVDPTALHQHYTLPRPEQDLSAGLRTALQQGRLEAWLASLAPQDDEYARLSRAYLSFREEASVPSGQRLASGSNIRPGDSDARVPVIAGQLVEGEYLAAAGNDAAGTRSVYTDAMVRAVRQLQRDFGIAADGVIGPVTLEVLNLRPGDRARALAVALERRRWLSRTPAATRIDVNIASARLRYYRDGTLADSRRVIVGKPGKETPPLLAPIFRLVANPTWTIPRSIQRGEMAGVSGAYLRRHNMVRRGGWIVQRSGPSNALGLVKFDMRDDQAIYLHDTSAPGLFERSQRHFSHGCVRVQDALGFAAILAADQGVTDAWERARASGRQSFVPLPRNIPVRLLYRNVFIDDAGAVSFRTDPYGWNAPIARALGFGQGAPAKAHADPIDVGP